MWPIGADITHMHPSANGAAIGLATFNDFRIFASCVMDLSGGMYFNVGSAVIMPEVFLKVFTIAQNLGAKLHDFTTVNLDMIMHYRAGENVVMRRPLSAARGTTPRPYIEILVPLLAQALVDGLREDSSAPEAVAAPVGKVFTVDQLVPLVKRWKEAGRTVVWTNGCFDLLHVGHVAQPSAKLDLWGTCSSSA